jgi:hypothetical protein
MAARTRAQVEADMARLQAELDGADTDDEVWIREDGHPAVQVKGKRATTILSRYSKLWEEDDPADGEEEGEEGDVEDPKPSGGYFGRKK